MGGRPRFCQVKWQQCLCSYRDHALLLPPVRVLQVLLRPDLSLSVQKNNLPRDDEDRELVMVKNRLEVEEWRMMKD